MAKTHSLEVSDSFWEKVDPLIPKPERDPKKEYKRKAGGGRKPMPPRQIFEAIMYVLPTGCQWLSKLSSVWGPPPLSSNALRTSSSTYVPIKDTTVNRHWN